MYKNKKDVDKHVNKLLSKLSAKEFKTRAYSFARLYFDVGDYASCQEYVEQYLTQKDNNAAAYKLLGQAQLKTGHKENALEQFKRSLDIDQTQTGTILDICELLADQDVTIEAGRAKYWLEKAEAIFPRHPITFSLRERLLTISNPDPEALVKLLTMELNARPKDPTLHARLLKHYLKVNQFKEAFEHSCNIEFGSNNFTNNYVWYEILDELLSYDLQNVDKWLYHLLLLTVRECMCHLSLIETPSGSSKSLIESADLLHAYDQALETVARAGACPGFAEFHANLLQHHRGQFTFHAATLLLKKAKKNYISWKDATRSAAPLMLMAWQTLPLDSKVNWLRNAPEKQINAVNRWYLEGTYRCSQSGHYLTTNFQDKNQSILDQISQHCSGNLWKETIYENIFATKSHLGKIKTSHIISNAFCAPQLRMPRKIEVESYDSDAQKEHGNSLHHFVWTLLNYKNYAHFKCTVFDMLTPTVTNCGPETLNKLDIYAFLYCAALTSQQQKTNEVLYIHEEKPCVLPANITDLLCPLPQMKWWDCAYKFSQNILGTELTDIRATLSRGIEVVRCIDSHGLDPELLCKLGRIFSDRAKVTTSVEEKNLIETWAKLYYESATPLLEKLKSKMMIKVSVKRLFDYTHKEMSTKELNLLIEESKLFVAVCYINDNENEKAIEILTNVKSQKAYYHLAQAYKNIGSQERNSSTSEVAKSKYVTMLSKAKMFAYKALDSLKEMESNKNLPIYSDTQELIEEIEININEMDSDLSKSMNDIDGNPSSDDNLSYRPETRRINSNMYRKISSTPKANQNNTNYRTAIDSKILDTTQVDQRYYEKIENEIQNLQKSHSVNTDFMEQTRNWFEENRCLGNKIMNTINSNIQNTTDQFKQLKISVDQVKDQIDKCKNECKDVGELKKQVAELKIEVNKLKTSAPEQTINERDLYNLDEEYRRNETNYGSQLPFPPQVLPTFNQRQPFPVPPHPYQLYNQTLFNLYNQYSQFPQPPVPGAQPLFDPSRAQMNFPGSYPTPEQMFLDFAHLIPPAAAAAPAVPPPVPPVVPTMPVPHKMAVPTTGPPVASAPPLSTSVFTKPITTEVKNPSRALPNNVVITSSDPLPTSVSMSTPVLSVTIPQKHINNKSNLPHNYQITMPSTPETNISSPPVFSFSMPDSNKNNSVSSLSNWNKAFQTFPKDDSPLYTALHRGEASKTVLDGLNSDASPNTSLNKSRTLSEKSNTSVENYDPCPDFKPIIPLPAEVKVTTGEEDECVIFSSRAKLFRFVDKQWKERGIGEMKLLKHKTTGKVRVLMRRDQVHKICANHIICPEMELNPMKNESKAYIWVANDFAEEAVVLEKFCIRFKTPDIAKLFYDTFEKARQESASLKHTSENKNAKPDSKDSGKSVIQTSHQSASAPSQSKTVVGGFTFSGTPVFKPLVGENKTDPKKADSEANKTSVFSNLTFKTGDSTPFSNIFTTPPFSTTSTAEPTKESNNKNELNMSDTVEEFEPTTEFKPVIALPALVEQQTGEEEEIALFEHRAKLLRFDSTTKEWKERGLGIIKLLVHKDNDQKVRLLMRREQIMKVCCNHILSKDTSFAKMPNMNKAVTWCAKDFSEGELIAETFCLRFKTVQVCDDFMNAIKLAQSKLNDGTKPTNEQNVPKETQIGFGDQFKAKAGSWYCQGCYTNNLESFAKCACCEQPKPLPSFTTKEDTRAEPKKNSNWGDKFKPKSGSWECKSCFVRNDAGANNCNACNNTRDSSKKPTTTKSADIKMNFSFGIPQQTAASIQNHKMEPSSKTIAPVASGFGDKFKPKQGSWECKQCFVRNEGGTENCCACNSPQDQNASKKSTNVTETTIVAPSVKFRFGIPPTVTIKEKPKTESIFEGTGASKFSFGIPAIAKSEGERNKNPTAIITDAPKATSKIDEPINFSSKTNDESKAQPEAPNSFTIGKESRLGFKFKAGASKIPTKSPREQGDESDDESLVKEEDCVAHFNPVIPLPDKVKVVTGEENEEELYGHRAKLYMYVSKEWKERGTGIAKILKHNDTGKLRVVMRREQVYKICLNFTLTSDISFNSKDDKTWLFAANDFSEGDLVLQNFCLRFANKEIALQFKNAVDNALKGTSSNIRKEKTTRPDQEAEDDVVFVSKTESNAEDKQKAKNHMLPENFYLYKNKEPCHGCRGCSDDDFKMVKSDTQTHQTTTVSAITAAIVEQNVTQASVATPLKDKIPTFSSPTNSVYGTPGNDKTFDTSIFRTPLGSIGSNTVASSPTSNSDSNGLDATNKENLFTQKSGFFTNFGEQKSIFGTPQGAPAPLFGAGDSKTPVSTKSSLLAPPKLSTSNLSSEKQALDVKSIFSSVQAKPAFEESSIFGSGPSLSSNKSIFSFAVDKSKDESSSEVKSIFQSNEASANLFSGASQGSIFGPGSLNSDQNKTGPITFGSGTTSLLGSATLSNTPKNNESSNHFSGIWGPITADQKPANELPLKVDNALSFAELSTSGPGFEKKPDFKWEGTGQQLFSSSQKNDPKEESDAADKSGNAEEEFDPHYEPIVPLPDKIVVTTGEEDEKKLFGERGKIFRFDDNTKEWKERGVGEVKILHHPERNTYRLLLRREQVHKIVLNMLLHMDIELHPMKNTETAWTFAGQNFADNSTGSCEMLAVRFKNTTLANTFRDQVKQCARSLQAAAAAAIRSEKEVPLTKTEEQRATPIFAAPLTKTEEQKATPIFAVPLAKTAEHKATPILGAASSQTEDTKETQPFGIVAPLRLPKHLQDSARADMKLIKAVQEASTTVPLKSLWSTATQQADANKNVNTYLEPNGDSKEGSPSDKQVHFQEPQEEEDEGEDDDNYEDIEFDQSDYYYQEEDAYYTCEGEAVVKQGDEESSCANATIQVLFDQDIYSPKILVTNSTTGEILADMLIHTDTEFLMSGDSCKWTGTDYTSDEPVDKTVTINFYESESAMAFYDSVETSKQATFNTNDADTE